MFRKLGPWFIFVAALFVMSLGIALVTRGNLGTTPISSLPLVSSYASGLTFGETTFFINLLFVAAQWLLLRKSINKLLLLSQIPITFAFSYFIDTSMQITEFLSSDIYWKCFAVSMLGNVVLGLGVALEVFADAARYPGEDSYLRSVRFCTSHFHPSKSPMTLFWFCWLYFLVTAFSTKYAGCGKELLFRRYASASL